TTTITRTTTITGATQEAKQEKGTDWVIVAAIIGAALFLPKLLKGKF
ncbi:unnamed protein product, partial [marine sediment metagenome]